jgi:AGZA family xanthine/uracil permease-like MFS transporter
VDGFFGLVLDNLVNLILIDALCRGVLGMPSEVVYGRVLPGAALSILFGNLYYARQARALMRREGRRDVCALPYGINTVSLFAHVFLVMLPAKLAAEAAGAEDPWRIAWQAGLLATLGSGAIEAAGAFVVDGLRRVTPRAALLSTLAGIALGFISMGFLFRTFAHPLVGLTTLAIVLVGYYGRVKFVFGLPAGLVAIAVGTALAWGSGLAPVGPAPAWAGFVAPVPVIGDVVAALSRPGAFLTYLGVIVPMGIFNVVGSLQNLESAEAAGDRYETTPSLVVNGLGSMVAALFGSPFPTTIYIGHPGWKGMGARAGYSWMTGAFLTAVCLSGTLSFLAWAIPVDAGMAIVLWIGIAISAQAMAAVPRAHTPAVVIGLLPGLAGWGAMMAKQGLRAGGVGAPGGPPFGEHLIPAFHATDTWIEGAFALEQGFIFTAMILAATTVAIIERRFRVGAVWLLTGAALALTGLAHGFAFTPGDTVLQLGPAWPWAAAYAAAALVLALAPWVTVPDDGAAHGLEPADVADPPHA